MLYKLDRQSLLPKTTSKAIQLQAMLMSDKTDEMSDE